MKSVMRETFRPRMRATSECANSCASTLAKKSSAVRMPSATRAPGGKLMLWNGPKALLSDQATSTKMNSQLRSMWIGMPKTRATRIATPYNER